MRSLTKTDPPMKSLKLSLAALAACALLAPTAGAQQLINRTVNVGGVVRSYIVYLPVNFNAAENMPAMFFFHGGGGTANGGIFECDFRPLANANRFIAVYPQAINSTSGTNSWDCRGDYHGGVDEVGFMSAMIDAVAADYGVDTRRIYAGGYSLGGSIVYDFAAYLPDRVAAIAPVAANMWEWTLSDVNWTTPVACIHILGTNDFYAPYNGNAFSISTAAQNAHFVGLNGAVEPPTVESLGGNITRYTWEPGTDCHGHQHIVRQGGGHDAPSDYTFGERWIWDFVSQYELDGVTGCSDPTTFCQTSLNASGSAALIGWSGSTSVSANDLTLLIDGANPGLPGIFFYGGGQTFLPFGAGFRCVDGNLFRLPVVFCDSTGSAAYPLDLGDPSLPTSSIAVGETWNFQFWYRDPLIPAVPYNVSNGLSVPFTP